MVSSVMAGPSPRESSWTASTSLCVFPAQTTSPFLIFLRNRWCVRRGRVAHDLLVQPGACVGPVAVRGGRGDAQGVGRLIDGQAGEVAQFDQVRLDRILPGQLLQ